jgi:hypothetical protein
MLSRKTDFYFQKVLYKAPKMGVSYLFLILFYTDHKIREETGKWQKLFFSRACFKTSNILHCLIENMYKLSHYSPCGH